MNGQPLGLRVGEALRPAAAHLFRPAVAGVSGLAFGAVLPPAWVMAGPQLCVFKLLAGLPCPGCGLTRSVVLALHGDLSGSLYFHPFGVLFVIAALVLAAVDLSGWWLARQRGETNRSPTWLLERLAKTPAPWVLIGALIVLWAVRLPMFLLGTWVY